MSAIDRTAAVSAELNPLLGDGDHPTPPTHSIRSEAMSTRPEESDLSKRPKTTVLTFQEKWRRGEPITMLTAYDYPTARAVDEAGIDAILVGDSLAMVVLGHVNTLSVTMEEMLHHARAVSRGGRKALLIGDMPFMSYQADPVDAVRNAGRFLAEGGMDAVKLEGGADYADTVRAIVRSGIPVEGHIGLTPQSVNVLGGFRVQGRTAPAAKQLLADARALEDAGCFSLVLESVPERLATYITERLSIPTIGIGAGPGTSGQVLVIHDLLGLYDRFTPKFAKRYAELGEAMAASIKAYRQDVEGRVFPSKEHAYSIAEDEWQDFLSSLGPSRMPLLDAKR
jgi:3-methyl-2-oxobutanoate hydroxymethyltransferase